MFDYIIQKVLLNYNRYCNSLQILDKYMRQMISSLYCYSTLDSIITNKGKRIRSILALDFYCKYNSNISDLLYKILALIELTHFGSLLHDDVIDDNNYRRNQASFKYLYGIKQSILTGDYLLIKVFDLFLNTVLNNTVSNKYLLNQFIKACTSTAYGACVEQQLNLDSNLQDYIKVAGLKTGSLFKFACLAGSALSNTEFDNVKYASIYGMYFGIIYQVQNDLNDYKCNTYQESEDYTQSNITFPIILINRYIQNIKHIFKHKSQYNYELIKSIIVTKKFNEISLQVLQKYLECLTNT